MIADNYWRERLTDEGKRIYDSVCLALAQGDNRAVVRIRAANAAQEAMRAVLYDKPQYFWFSSSVRFSMSLRGSSMEWSPLYKQRDIPQIQRAFSSAVAACRANGEVETEKKIAEYLVRSVRYAVDNTYNQNAAAALYFKEAQCSGFASAVKYLCDELGIWCIMVDGTLRATSTGRTEPHAWNIVRIGGVYYHLDVTNMAGANTDKPKDLRFMYFNYADSQMSNYTWNRASVPACVTNTGSPQTKGASGNLCFTNMAALRTEIEKACKDGRESMTFSLSVGESTKEKMSLVESSLQMVFNRLGVRSSVRIEGLGDFVTIYFK